MTRLQPAFRAAGVSSFTVNNVANPTNLTPGLPTRVTGDLLLIWTWSRSNTATVSAPAGWVVLAGFPLRSATASGGTVYVFARVSDGGDAAPTVTWTGLATTTSGDASGAVICSYSGVETLAGAANVLDGSAASSDQAGSTATVTIPSVTTSFDRSLRLGLALKLLESAGATWTIPSGWDNEEADLNTTTGTGHFVEIADDLLVAIGATGTATATPSVTTSSRALGVSLALKARNLHRGAVNFQDPGVFARAWRRARGGLLVPDLWVPDRPAMI